MCCPAHKKAKYTLAPGGLFVPLKDYTTFCALYITTEQLVQLEATHLFKQRCSTVEWVEELTALCSSANLDSAFKLRGL